VKYKLFQWQVWVRGSEIGLSKLGFKNERRNCVINRKRQKFRAIRTPAEGASEMREDMRKAQTPLGRGKNNPSKKLQPSRNQAETTLLTANTH
jgi:hypothetical protein